MAQYLLAYLSDDYSHDAVQALRPLIDKLASQGQWSQRPPEFVDQVEEDSRTRPEDESVRTVGLVLVVSESGERPPTPVDEIARVIDALAKFSQEQAVEFELQLDDTYVGKIRQGVPDLLLREGLLARW